MGIRMLFVQPLTPELQPTGRRIICTDCTGAGHGRAGLLGPRQRGELPVSTRRAAHRYDHRRDCRFGASAASRPRRRAAPETQAQGRKVMLIARVVGELVATQKHPSHEGRKLLLVQPLNLDGSNRGDAVVALDAVDAGVGDKVLIATEGFSAMTSVGRPQLTD